MSFGKLESIYAKLQHIQELMGSNLADMAKDYNLSVSELMMVVDIKTYPNTDLQSVCARLGLKKSLASKILKKLVEEGVILRSQDSTDQRKVCLNYHQDNPVSACKEEALNAAFKGEHRCESDLVSIENSLNQLIEMLSQG